MGSFSFSKNERLLNRKDFVNLNRLGKRRHSAHFVIVFNGNGRIISRLGISVGKKTGNAVTRNRIKRLIREFFRLHRHEIPKGYDIVIAAKRSTGKLNYWKVKEELGEFLLDKKSVT